MPRPKYQIDPATARYLATLRRIPKEIVLDMAFRDFDMGDPDTCICGWAFRESLAARSDVDASNVSGPVMASDRDELTSDFTCRRLAAVFGSTRDAWNEIYWGVTGTSALFIEEAFTLRVQECVR